MANQTKTIPKGWKMTTLGEVAEIIAGYAFKSRDFGDHGFPVAKITEIKPPYVDFSNCQKVNIQNYSLERLKKYKLNKGDYLVAMTGATIGKVGKITDEIEAYLNQRVAKIGEKEGLTDKRFIYHLVSSLVFTSFIEKFAFGAVQANISTTEIGNFPILLPPILEQRAIAAVLSSLDDKIELLREQSKTLEATAQAIFKEWFVNFNFPGATGKMIDSELGEIPEGWRVKIIEELTIQLNSGGTPSTKENSYYNGNINWFSTKELQDNFVFESEKKITSLGLKNSSAKMFPVNTIVMAIYAAPTVGRLGILAKKSTFNQATVGLVAKDEIGYPFLYLLLKNLRGAFNRLANGAAQQNLNVGLVKNFKINHPNQTTFKAFNDVMQPIFTKLKDNNSQIQTLSALRDALLPKLMKGEVRVKGFKE